MLSRVRSQDSQALSVPSFPLVPRSTASAHERNVAEIVRGGVPWTVFDSLELEEREGWNCSKRRCSVVAYFDRILGDGKGFLELLAMHNAYVFGSAAVEYFRDGSTSLESGCDIAVLPDFYVMSSFLSRAASIGFTFMSTEDMISYCATRQCTELKVGMLQAHAVKESLGLSKGAQDDSANSGTLFWDGEKVTISLSSDCFWGESPSSSVIYGMRRVADRDTLIRVMMIPCGSSETPRCLLHLHCSHLQCFISSKYVGHMYPDHLRRSISTVWRRTTPGDKNNPAESMAVSLTCRKWGARGVSFVEHDGTETQRCIANDGFIHKHDGASAMDDFACEELGEGYSHFRWDETANGTLCPMVDIEDPTQIEGYEEAGMIRTAALVNFTPPNAHFRDILALCGLQSGL